MMITKNCVGCGACCSVCGQQCITMKSNDEGFFEPFLDKSKCTNCGMCRKVCPVLSGYEPEMKTISAYMFVNSNEYHRNLSSSGGFCKALGDKIIDEGGVVFGAQLTDEHIVRHCFVDKKDDFFKLMGSKYVQSEVGNSLYYVKQFLEDGKTVLFTGTPCQIGGLKTYLGVQYDKLITLELFCAGIPSQTSWKSYLSDYYDEDTIRYIQFRYKGKGWWKYGLRIQFLKDDYFYPNRSKKDPFISAFLNGYSLNKPCYDCKFKGDNKNADYSIGDAWNINRIRTNMDDDRGVTIVLVNSQNAQKYLDELSEKHNCYEVSLEEALFAREEWNRKKEIPNQRDEFMKKMKANGFKCAYESLK